MVLPAFFFMANDDGGALSGIGALTAEMFVLACETQLLSALAPAPDEEPVPPDAAPELHPVMAISPATDIRPTIRLWGDVTSVSFQETLARPDPLDLRPGKPAHAGMARRRGADGHRRPHCCCPSDGRSG